MKELDRGRPMRAIHRKTGEVGTVKKVVQSKMLLIDGSNPEGWQGYFDRHGNPKDEFCPWRVENAPDLIVTKDIDWSNPIEAVHNGIIRRAHLVFEYGNGYKRVHLGEGPDWEEYVCQKDGDMTDDGIHIRNTPTYTDAVMELGDAAALFEKEDREPETTPVDKALWERVVGLVRDVASYFDEKGQQPYYAREARAIAELLPQVAHPDLIEARKIAFEEAYSESTPEVLTGAYDSSGYVKAALAAIKRGRELERGQ